MLGDWSPIVARRYIHPSLKFARIPAQMEPLLLCSSLPMGSLYLMSKIRLGRKCPTEKITLAFSSKEFLTKNILLGRFSKFWSKLIEEHFFQKYL
jgi:hypothetical protein